MGARRILAWSGFLIMVCSVVPGAALAYELNSSSAQSLTATPDTFQTISAPVSGFIDTLRHIGDVAGQSVSGISSGGQFYIRTNDWLTNAAGIDISGVLRAVGGFLVWVIGIAILVLHFISDFIQGAISHL